MSDPGSSLGTTTVRNVAWLGGVQAFRQVLGIVTTLLVARFLQPSDYGIFAMTLFVNELAQLFIDFGIGSALIQRKQVDQRLLSSCFWLNVGIGLLAAVVVVAGAPLAAAYFKQPLVAQLLLVSALTLCVAAVSVLPQALLSRRLAFQQVALATAMGSIVAAGATLALAAAGFGVWSLAFQPLVGTTVTCAALMVFARWRPSLEFSVDALRGVLRFSSQLLAGNLLGHVNRNLPHLILGPALGAAATGAISMAQTIAWLPVAQFTAAAVRASFPAFAQIQDARARMEGGLFRALDVVALFAFPVLLGLAVTARDLVPLVFGAQWSGISPLVPVFCALSLVQSVTFLSSSTLLASGRADVAMYLALASLPLLAGTLWWLQTQPLIVICAGLVAAQASVLLLGMGLALRNLSSTWGRLLAHLARPLLASGLAAGAVLLLQWQLQDQSGLVRLILSLSLGALLYALLTWALNRAAAAEAWSLVRQAFQRRAGARTG